MNSCGCSTAKSKTPPLEIFFYPLNGSVRGSQPSLTTRDRELVSVLEVKIEPETSASEIRHSTDSTTGWGGCVVVVMYFIVPILMLIFSLYLTSMNKYINKQMRRLWNWRRLIGCCPPPRFSLRNTFQQLWHVYLLDTITQDVNSSREAYPRRPNVYFANCKRRKPQTSCAHHELCTPWETAHSVSNKAMILIGQILITLSVRSLIVHSGKTWNNLKHFFETIETILFPIVSKNCVKLFQLFMFCLNVRLRTDDKCY